MPTNSACTVHRSNWMRLPAPSFRIRTICWICRPWTAAKISRSHAGLLAFCLFLHMALVLPPPSARISWSMPNPRGRVVAEETVMQKVSCVVFQLMQSYVTFAIAASAHAMS